MATYIDTSALLRVVERHGDIATVEAALGDQPFTSSLAEIECWASLHRKWLDGELTQDGLDDRLVSAGRALDVLSIVPLDDPVLSNARVVSRRHPLRTLDALHLATAVTAVPLVERRGMTLRFCTADRRQAQAAERELGAANVHLVPPWR